MTVSARFLLRFDDICATMNWMVWDRVERILVEHDIRPILALVPDNADPKLAPHPHNPDYVARVSQWRERGWELAQHGFRHILLPTNANALAISNLGEFAGHAEDVQNHFLQAGREKLQAMGIVVRGFVAPAHSYDATTCALLADSGYKYISDGLGIRATRDKNDLIHVPQQLWRYRNMPAGLWTVCLHINGWGDKQVHELESALEKFGARTISIDDVISRKLPRENHADQFVAFVGERFLKARKKLARSES